MGNSENKIQTSRNVESFHDKFQKVEILQNSEQMILSIPYEQKQDIIEWQKLLKTVKQCDPEFLLMPKKYMITEQGLCSSSGVIKIVYDNFTFSFEEQIKNHAQKYKHFQEPEVWYLLFAIISSVKEMDRLSIKVGDIRPYNVFVNQNGQVKLSGVYSWPRQVENFLKTSYDKTVTYLAPQELNQCRIGQRGKKSYVVGQSFSVGLTLLHTCLLKPMEDLYNVKKFEFNVQKLEQNVNELRNLTFWNQDKEKNDKYSDSLINIISGLLDLNENNRLTTLQLFDELQPHAEEILNLKEFQLPNIRVNTPTKTAVDVIGKIPNNSKIRLSPQYSSIQKKQYNQPESLAFQATHNFVIPVKTIPNYTIPQRHTPQKNKNSKQKLQISLSSEKKRGVSKTNQPSRQNLSRQRVPLNSNPNLTSIGKNGSYPLQNHFTGEFKLTDNQFQSYRPSIGINSNPVPQYGQRKFQVPVTLNSQTVSNYVSYQPKFQMPREAQYRTISQQPTYNYNAVLTNFSYKPTAPQTQPGYVPSSISYPFSKNVDLTKSEYTYIEKNASFGFEREKVSFQVGNQQGGLIEASKQNYQTSMVKPILPGQSSFTTGMVNFPLTQNRAAGGQSDLLKKIDQQLNKSKMMYPTGTVV